MIFEGPSGRMGAPENPARFERFDAGDLTVYVERGLLEQLEPGAQQMLFYIDGYGRFGLDFEKARQR